MIKIEALNKYFNHHKKNEIHVINNTSLELEDSGLVAFLGSSGSGKTTLLNVIGGLDKFNNGNFYIDGIKITKRNYYKMDKIRNLNIGYIFQDYKLLDNLTVYDNVSLVLKMLGVDNTEIKKRVDYVLETLGIYKYRNRLCSMLSGGERQRVGIARALVKNPKIILADEPTGNLDSKNSIEIMNIIKSISKDRLVILVTHEEDLANFYASRIIKISDGVITDDFKNIHNDELDYRIDNKIYLKDFKNHTKVSKEDINLNVYSDNSSKLDFDIVFKNGNIYIKSNSKEKVELIDDDSNIELIDEHYKKINKEIYEKYKYSLDEVSTDIKYRYKSIYNPITMITKGFKKLFSFSILKKILLLGFFATGIVMMYAVSSIAAAIKVDDYKFVTYNKNYFVSENHKIDISLYKKIEALEDTIYVLPGDSIVTLNFKYDKYYQSDGYLDTIKGSVADINMISDTNLIYGEMPKNKGEIVVDLMVYNSYASNHNNKYMGITSPSDFIGKMLYTNTTSYKVVGMTDLHSPSIYTYQENFISMLNSTDQSNYYYSSSNTFIDYESVKDNITITDGRLPINDYEVMLNKYYYGYVELGKEFDHDINGHPLIIVGYYESKDNNRFSLVNSKMIKYNLIEKSNMLTVYTKDHKNITLDDISFYDSYVQSKNTYENMINESVNIKIAFSAIMMIISFIEIYLIMRSSFLSRIKEIGILRAIGVKKIDILKMFAGEIIAITTLSAFIGIILMSYIISMLVKINYLKDSFVINPLIFIINTIIIYVSNLIFGLVPVLGIIEKTPSNILSRNDVD